MIGIVDRIIGLCGFLQGPALRADVELLVAEAKAEAWDEGAERGLNELPDSYDISSSDVDKVYRANPYRGASQ